MMTIWYTNPTSFMFGTDSLFDIVPQSSMSLDDQLNAIMRFAIYFTIILFIIKRDPRVIFFALFAGVLTWIIHAQYSAEQNKKTELFKALNLKENFKNKACIKPTQENPFMNVTFSDYSDFPNRPKACKISDSHEETSAEFEKGLHRLEDDVYNKSASDRQFFTNPSTTIPNNQQGFAEWLYKTGPTCKEKSLYCN